MRHAIVDARGVFYTVHKEIETKPLTAPADIPNTSIKKGDVIGHEHIFAPIFDSLKEMDASKFDTEADALVQIAAWDDAVQGCKTVEVK